MAQNLKRAKIVTKAVKTTENDDNNELEQPLHSSRKRLISTLFNTWDLGQYPRTLKQALEKVEKNVYIKEQLHKMDVAGNNGEDSLDGKQHRGKKGGIRIGLDQLTTFELDDTNSHDVSKILILVPTRQEIARFRFTGR